MEVLPEVRAAATQLAALADETLDLVQGLEAMSVLALVLIPTCVGVSITVVVDGDPFTVTTTSEDVKAVDATQYLDGGPCVAASELDREVRVDDVLDEQQWQLYARAAAANGIRASLSIPVRRGSGDAVGALNLYASEPGAFSGKEAQLAALFGVHTNDLVSDADLTFMTREFARELPQRLADHAELNQAVGVLVARNGWTAEQARERLDYAAVHAKTSRSSVARAVMVLDT